MLHMVRYWTYKGIFVRRPKLNSINAKLIIPIDVPEPSSNQW